MASAAAHTGGAVAAPATHQAAAVDDIVVDVNDLSWVNSLLGSLWPKANMAVRGFLHNELTPRLQEILPFKRLCFKRFTLGKNIPEFGPIEVLRHSECHVQVELDVRYFSDVDLLVDTGTAGITFGINQLTFVGRLCLSLKPLVQTWPVIGGVQLFFASQPRVGLRFAGLAQIAEFPGLAEKVQDVVDDFFRNHMVLPNCRSYPFTRDQRIMSLTAVSHQPLGVLRVRVIRARNLAGVNWKLGAATRFTSDPYCVLRVGAASCRTSTVARTTDPEWPANEPSLYFVVYHREQSLEISVASEDKGILRGQGFGGFLGSMDPVRVRTILADWPAKPGAPNGERCIRRTSVPLNTTKVNKALLHVDDPMHSGSRPSILELEAEWLDLWSGPTVQFGSGTNAPAGLVLVELHSGSGFPERAVFEKKGLRWRCSLVPSAGQEQQDPIVSRRGQYREDEDLCLDQLPIHPRVIPVVERLNARGLHLQDIADICDTSEDVIEAYLRAVKDRKQRRLERQMASEDEYCVDLRWNQLMQLLVRRPEESSLLVELLNGDDQPVGRLEVITLQQLMSAKEGSLPPKEYALMTQSADKSRAGGLSAWLFPSCNKPLMATGRYRAVQVELSARLQPLVAGNTPREFGDPLLAGADPLFRADEGRNFQNPKRRI